MYLFISKIIFASSIFFLTLIAGVVPLKIAKHNVRFLSLCNAFASGIFLSTALLHLLPEAVAKFSVVYSSRYPRAYLICLVTFILMLLMERGVFMYGKNNFSDNKNTSSIFLVLLLTIHSLVEGAAIGINPNLLEASTIFFAVFAHKGSESFALTASLHRFELATKNIKRILAMYALMTPLGIIVAFFFTSTLITNSNNLLGAYFSSIAAGTFLYLGTEHLVEGQRSFEQFSEIAALTLGIMLMALVAFWV